jgi:uncharacterized protein
VTTRTSLNLALSAVPALPQGALAVPVQGQTLWLLPDRAAYWVEQRTLLVADVHIGKATSFRALGVPVPSGTTGQNFRRLSALLHATQAQRLVVLGDLIHARHAHTADIHAQALAWRALHAGVDVVLVRGNHDSHAGDPPLAWNVRVWEEPFDAAPFALRHTPPSAPVTSAAPGPFWLAGHVHPVVKLRGLGKDSARLPCFVLTSSSLQFPAFGEFTGGFDVTGTAGRDGAKVYALSSHVHAL